MVQQLIKVKPQLNPCLTPDYQNNKGFSLRVEEIDSTSVKILSKKNESTITVPKDLKVLKTATSSLTPTVYENLFLKAIKYCFIPRCGSMVQRCVSYMAEYKNYLLHKIFFSSLVANHYRKIPSQPAFMHQSLIIPKQILKTIFL